MSKHDRLEFLNLWYVLIIINDVLLVGGSIIKELMENQVKKKISFVISFPFFKYSRFVFISKQNVMQHIDSDMWDVCSVLLGTGNLFVWFGVLRYLGFFRTYNMLIVTLKKAFPSVLRFLLCAMLIYAGFTFCGWLIFGPYHFKVLAALLSLFNFILNLFVLLAFFKSHFSFSSPFQIKNYAEEETSEVGWDDLARQTF